MRDVDGVPIEWTSDQEPALLPRETITLPPVRELVADRLHPDDILIVKVGSKTISMEVASRLRERLKAFFPKNEVLILGRGLDRGSRSPDRPAEDYDARRECGVPGEAYRVSAPTVAETATRGVQDGGGERASA